jgi:hypothetical protein
VIISDPAGMRAYHLTEECPTAGSSVVTGMTMACTRDPYCTLHPDEDCPNPDDPGPIPTLVSIEQVQDVIRGLSPEQRENLLFFLAGYDTNAIVTAISWLREREGS